MKHIAVIYKSNYGTTKQYAEWIAEALGADIIERSSARPERLMDYDIVVYGGGLYASGILGVELVTKNPCNKLVIFTVGLADPETTDYTGILEKNLPVELRKSAKVFHLRGGIDYKKLSIVHRGMMAMMKKMTIGKKTDEELSEEERAFADTYGNQADFTNRQAIQPVIEYIRNEIHE